MWQFHKLQVFTHSLSVVLPRMLLMRKSHPRRLTRFIELYIFQQREETFSLQLWTSKLKTNFNLCYVFHPTALTGIIRQHRYFKIICCILSLYIHTHIIAGTYKFGSWWGHFTYYQTCVLIIYKTIKMQCNNKCIDSYSHIYIDFHAFPPTSISFLVWMHLQTIFHHH